MTFLRRRPSPHRILWPLAGVVLMCAPAPALAGTVSVETGEVVFQAEPGELNDVTVLDTRVPPRNRSVVDLGAPLVPGVGCLAGTPVICASTAAVIYLGNRDDRGVAASTAGNSTIHGERGDDFIRSDGLDAYAYGGPGQDDIGVSADVARAYGGPGADSIIGNAGVFNDLQGEGGDDYLVQGQHAWCALFDGGPGDDRMVGTQTNCRPLIATQTGGNGDDSMSIEVPPGVWTVGWFMDGGRGDDSLSGSPGPDRFDAGPGWDSVDATGDSASDTIACGRGRDAVIADATDVVAEDCERVTVAAP